MESSAVNKFLDSLPFAPVVLMGAVFAIMPIVPEPHLVQKAQMLMQGVTLVPMDWFDIVLHGGAGVLALLRLRRRWAVAEQDND